MKSKWVLLWAILAGVAIGVPGGIAIRGQQAKAGPGYVFAEVDVTDPAGMQKYGAQIAQTLAPFKHHYVILGNNIQPLEGDAPKGTIVMIAFDSVEKARAWYDSPAYAAIRPIRQSSAKSRIFIVEGLADQP